VLLGTQDVAGAADLEVREGDLVAGAQVRGREDGVQPLARDGGERLPAPVQQVGVRTSVRSADPAAELVELRQP
jgi:hypothetical protein